MLPGLFKRSFFCWGEFYFILTELLVVEFLILACLVLVRKELTRVCADRHGSTAPKLKLDMYHLPVPCRADCCPLRRQWATQLVGGMFLHEAYSESISCDAHALPPEILMRAHQSAAENSTKLMYCLSYVCKKDKYLTIDYWPVFRNVFFIMNQWVWDRKPQSLDREVLGDNQVERYRITQALHSKAYPLKKTEWRSMNKQNLTELRFESENHAII